MSVSDSDSNARATILISAVVVEGRDINRLFLIVENKASSDTCMLPSKDGVALRNKK